MNLVFRHLRNFRNPVPQLTQFFVEGRDVTGLSNFISLIIFWTLSEHLRLAYREEQPSNLPHLFLASGSTPQKLALVETLKLAFVGVARLRSGGKDVPPRRTVNNHIQDEERRGYYPFHQDGRRNYANEDSYSGSTRPVLLTVLAALLFALQNYATVIAQNVVDPIVLYITFAFVTLFALLGVFSFLGRPFASFHWQAALLQACGLFIAQTAVRTIISTSDPFPALLCLVLYRSLALVLIDHLYTIHRFSSIHTLHMHLFAYGLLIHILVFITQHFFSHSISSANYNTSLGPQFSDVLLLICQAGVDLASLAIIYDYDAMVEGLVRSFSAACFILYSCGLFGMRAIVGCFIVFAGSFAYQKHSNGEHPEKNYQSKRVVLGVMIYASLSLYAAYAMASNGLPMPLRRLPSVAALFDSSEALCKRNPRPLSRIPDEDRVYHAFDDVLLIVFFSHARYNVNLDYYRLTYEEFFPNMVFVGPASREDEGFEHSYDVLVDSYQSDEDLNSDPNYYKMAGRETHPCYDGYLWAPFDTLLNLPRLQQFDQGRVWYHSPFGQYVYNPALKEQNSNASRHVSPANISPDPAISLSETWKGWGPDWWWGDPHVGLEVCLPALEKAPSHMRTRLASLTNGTRLIGGSADTLYIPGKYSQEFMQVLSLFLETNCFLEIATPTALHLIVSPQDTIQFVDHWWIWQPPFNATFVRQKWGEGFEVDTFHTFHWGDKSEDGVWRGNHANIGDVRKLLVESAGRQHVEFPHLDWNMDDRGA